MLLLWIGILTVAALPDLHHRLHKDAQNASHTCAITHVQEEGLLSGLAFLMAPVPELVPVAPFSHSEVVVPSTRDYRLSPSRAPPVPCSSFKVVG